MKTPEGMGKVKKKSERTCQECFHCQACHLWSNSQIPDKVAQKCPQFESIIYVKLRDLAEMKKMMEEMHI